MSGSPRHSGMTGSEAEAEGYNIVIMLAVICY